MESIHCRILCCSFFTTRYWMMSFTEERTTSSPKITYLYQLIS